MNNRVHLVTTLLCTLVLVSMLTSALAVDTTSPFFMDSSQDNPHSDNAISSTYQFEQPILKQLMVDETQYHKIVMPSVSSIGQPGEPCLPEPGVKILLPPGTDVITITVAPGEELLLGSNIKVIPAMEAIPISQQDVEHKPQCDERIYSSTNAFPGRFFTQVGTYQFRGYSVLVVTLHPVQYIPASGEVLYYPELEINVETTDQMDSNSLYRGFESDRESIETLVDNPTTAQLYLQETRLPSSGEVYDLVIITNRSLTDDFQPLKLAHDTEGLETFIYSLEDIYNNYSGIDSQEQIRNFIRDAYTTWGVEYVLLGGDHEVIPTRRMFFGMYQQYECYGASDLYYACLDGSYNADGDRFWGEPTDGDDGRDVDLIAEVFIGRACVENATEVGFFVNKTLAYMNTNDEYLNDVVMAGECLDMLPTWGGDCMEELIYGASTHGYTTVGIPSSEQGYNITRLYDQLWPDYPETPYHDGWPKRVLIGHINNGTHIINHLGHSGYHYNMKLQEYDTGQITDVSDLINTEYCFIYSQGCHAGYFDIDHPTRDIESMAEYFTSKTEHGAFAGVWNSNYGWYMPMSTDGPSQRYHREFWDAVFGENISVLGKVNQDSKLDNIHQINHGRMRWCFYQLNLFGDPTMCFKRPWLADNNVGVESLHVDPEHSKPHESITVNTTIFNKGQTHAGNVHVSLCVNGHEEDSTTIALLRSRTEQAVLFEWTPSSPGKYTLTVNVTILGVHDEDYRDNEQTQVVHVGVWNQDSNQHYTTIQEALTDSLTLQRHTLVVPPGVYQENLVIDKSITLVGYDHYSTIIDGPSTYDDVISIHTHNVTINGVTLTNGRSGIGTSLAYPSRDLVITNTVITENDLYGILLADSHHNLIIGNMISANENEGIYLNTNSSYNSIVRNTIHGNEVDGIIAVSSHYNIIRDNIISDNSYGISLRFSHDNLLYHNNFLNNSQGNAYDNGNNAWDNGPLNGGNYWDDYQGFNTDDDDIGDIPYSIPGGTSQDRYPLMHPWASTLFVDDDHTMGPWYGTELHPYHSIQDGIDHARPHEIVFILNGYYPETIVIDQTITLQGEDRNTTIIDGNRDDMVVTITADWVNVSRCTIQNSSGQDAGIGIYADHATISGNCLSNNEIGILVSSHSNTIQTNSVIFNTYAGIILDYSSSDNHIQHNNISTNTGYGIVLLYDTNNNTLVHNSLSHNHYAGIWLRQSHDNTITGNILFDNNDAGIGALNPGGIQEIGDTITPYNDYGSIAISSSCHNQITGNTLLSNGYAGILVEYNSSNNTIIKNTIADTRNGSGVVLAYWSKFNTIKANAICRSAYTGIELSLSDHNLIQGNRFRNDGFFVTHSYHNTIVDNTVNNLPLLYLEGVSDTSLCDKVGQIILVDCHNITIQNHQLLNTSIGIELYNTTGCKINENIIAGNNYAGLFLYDSYENAILENTITDNAMYGIFIDYPSENNRMYHNNFINNKASHAYDEWRNTWDNDYPDGGNYWSDYNLNDSYHGAGQAIPGPDGIGDSSYTLPPVYSSGEDRYPLMQQNGWSNKPPLTPARPTGRRWCFIDKEYTYTTQTDDPEGYSLYYNFSWGDGEYTGWIGPYISGEEVNASHRWTTTGIFTVRIVAKDTREVISDWSPPLRVRIVDIQPNMAN